MLAFADANGKIAYRGFHRFELADGRVTLVWARGYCFLEDGTHLLDDEISTWVAAQLVNHSVAQLVPTMNGFFMLVVIWQNAGKIEVSSGRFESHPFYFALQPDGLLFGDDYWELVRRLDALHYNPQAALSMALMGYVANSQTLLSDLREVRPAAVTTFSLVNGNWQMNYTRYWVNRRHELRGRSYEQWRKELSAMLQRVFARQAGAIIQRGWNGIVPLSSGLDSRVVAGMLRHHGAPLKAFTYGPAGNQESQYAKAVADALQIEMRMVSNDNAAGLIPGLLDDMVRRVGMQTRFTAGMGVTIAFTEPQPGTVFLPGHPGNLPTGDVIPRGIHLLRNHQQAIQQIINNYALPVREEVIARVLPGWTPESRMEILSTEWTFDPSDPVGSVDEWSLNYHFRRLLLSEMTTYSFYGHWMLPFCDYELVDFFNSVPEEYWAHRRLHIDALIHEVFVDDLAALATLPIAGKRGVPHLPKTTWQDQVVNLIPKSVVGDMVLRRATQSKERDIHNQEGLSVDRPFGPDPLEYWWQHGPDFRDFVIKQYRDWDGMGGIVDVPELLKVIEQPLTPFYQRFGLAIFLTLRAFQRIVENESGNINTRSWSPTRDIGIEG